MRGRRGRWLAAGLLICAAARASELRAASGYLPYYAVVAGDAGPWTAILSSVGLQARDAGEAHVLVARAGAAAAPQWAARVDDGAILILEGESPLADLF